MKMTEAEIRDALVGSHPFELLPEAEIAALSACVDVVTTAGGDVVIEPGQRCGHLYLLRRGAVETRSGEGFLLGRLGEGEAFALSAMLGDGEAVNRVTALEDSVFLRLPEAEFRRLIQDYPAFKAHFAPYAADRLRAAQREATSEMDLTASRVGDMIEREPVAIDASASIRDAARTMRDNRVSCLPVCDGHKLVGIVTDTDLRNRVVAEGLGYDASVRAMMTADPSTLDWGDSVLDALLLMTQRTIRHVPVLRDGRLAGVVTTTNLVRQQTHSAVYLAGDIYKQTDFAGLARVVRQIPQMLRLTVEAGATAYHVGRLVTSIADATARRLMQLGEEKLGPAPVPWLWLAAGSQGRQEQTGVSDQDNCMILDDSYDEARHGEYFKALADFISDGLNACGYVYCPGEMMAVTDKWRQPYRQWSKYFTGWIDEPEPMALMLSSVFFDLRPIYGETALYDELQQMILQKAQSSRLFVAHMVGNALKHEPPIGFFRNFVLIRDDEHRDQLDLKHSGVVPIVDIARIYALEGGIKAVNTLDRLRTESAAKMLSSQGARDLLDSYEFIATIRLKHQAQQIRDGEAPDNFLSPEWLSPFERSHLKNAFTVVKTIQSALSSNYGASHLG